MKQKKDGLVTRVLRIIRDDPEIPENVLQQIRDLHKLEVRYACEVAENHRWDFKSVVLDYMHTEILWRNSPRINDNGIIPLSEEDAMSEKNVLVHRVLWGENAEVYFWGTMSFVKLRKGWLYIGKNEQLRLRRLPDFNECFAQYTTLSDEVQRSKYQDMKDLYFRYEKRD